MSWIDLSVGSLKYRDIARVKFVQIIVGHPDKSSMQIIVELRE